MIEPNIYMRKIGKLFIEDQPEFKAFETLSHTFLLPFQEFDLITIAYVLEEINTPEDKLLVLKSLWHKVAPGGVMVLVCPGTPVGFRYVNDFRNMLRENAKILAPCPHSLICPMSEKGT